MQQDDLQIARGELDRAVRAWRWQPRYQWNAAFLAARAHDTVGVLKYLQAYADLGLGRNLRADSTYAAWWSNPRFRTIEKQHTQNRASVVRSKVQAILPDSTFWPEGMDVDPRSGTIYVASIRHGVIAEIKSDGTVREILARGRSGFGSLLGVRIDTAHNVLYATIAGLPNAERYVSGDSSIAALLRINISDGRILRRWDLPAVPGGHVLGDVHVAPNGDVYTTDSFQPVVYRLRRGEDTLQTISSPLFTNLQGMAATPDGRFLYLADYLVGLMRVDLATGAVARLTDAPRSTSVGCDGIVLDGRSIIAIQNGVQPPRVVRFSLESSGTRIVRVDVLDQNAAVAIEPTIGALAGGRFYYVANSQWDLHNDDGTPIKGANLTKPLILSVRFRD